MGVAMTQHPELFAAVSSEAPLLDMLRYHKLPAGASWIAEYGDPDKPQEAAYLRRYSPFHNLDPAKAYPEVLFMTSTKDDRVHPAHARKMAARMADLQRPFLYFEHIEGGHAPGANLKQRAEIEALRLAYFWEHLGPAPERAAPLQGIAPTASPRP